VLFVYVATHLLNHALGLISLDAAEAGRIWFTALWRSALGTALLYAGLVVHLALVLRAVFERRHFRIPRWEITRLLLGLLIPFLLLAHVARTRVAHELLGVEDTYTRQMLIYWVADPWNGFQQVLLLVVAWVHGCLGVHYWLRTKRWHARLRPSLRVAGLLVPVFALIGFVSMGKEIADLADDPAWIRPPTVPLAAAGQAVTNLWRDRLVGGYMVLVAGVFLARDARTVWQRRRGVVRVTYPNGRRVAIAPGTTVLEASRAAGIPHASLCGGRGRCSTCRSRVGTGGDGLPAPSSDELRVLRRVGAPANVRLACQVRPTADVDVFPLLPAGAGPGGAAPPPGLAQGTEQEIAILFADMRSFSRISEHMLPYDVVFLLNQYFAAMGRAIEASGGYLDKFIGDGIMALFGLSSGARRGCAEALDAAAAMSRALEELNRALAGDIGEPLRIGIGIHVGPAIVGELGYGGARSMTAVGDAVNVASRLEAVSKEHAAELVISADVALRAGIDLSRFPSYEIAVRGRTTPLAVYVVTRGSDLAAPT